MLTYKNVVFDFGNVLAAFDEDYILSRFCTDPSDLVLLKKAVFANWAHLDAGTADYEEARSQAVSLVPEHLQTAASSFFEEWHQYLLPITGIWDLIYELKRQSVPVYLLSNAPTHFAEHADYYEIVKEFDGIVFSAPLKMAKPEPEIYQYLFRTFNLNPEECFFIDDKPENIEAGRTLGMNGIIFNGDIDAVRRALGM